MGRQILSWVAQGSLWDEESKETDGWSLKVKLSQHNTVKQLYSNKNFLNMAIRSWHWVCETHHVSSLSRYVHWWARETLKRENTPEFQQDTWQVFPNFPVAQTEVCWVGYGKMRWISGQLSDQTKKSSIRGWASICEDFPMIWLCSTKDDDNEDCRSSELQLTETWKTWSVGVAETRFSYIMHGRSYISCSIQLKLCFHSQTCSRESQAQPWSSDLLQAHS